MTTTVVVTQMQMLTVVRGEVTVVSEEALQEVEASEVAAVAPAAATQVAMVATDSTLLTTIVMTTLLTLVGNPKTINQAREDLDLPTRATPGVCTRLQAPVATNMVSAATTATGATTT